MSTREWQEATREAWRRFYTTEHMETILRRMVALRSNKKLTTVHRLVLYSYYGRNSTIHPIDGGILRIKARKDRRPTMKRESPVFFYPKYLTQLAESSVGMFGAYLELRRCLKNAMGDPNRLEYTDQALTL